MNYRELTKAISEAMIDRINGVSAPNTPAIMIDRNNGKEYYGSAINAQIGDTIITEIGNGFGSWEPKTECDIDVAAAGYAAELLTRMGYLFCRRKNCGHTWYPRSPHRPGQCPQCHTSAWDRERTDSTPGPKPRKKYQK